MTTPARAAAHPIESLFLERWSPRAYDGSAIPQADLDTILEAARWAPSAFNYQPWRFLYAHRDGADWQDFLGALLPFNQGWVKNAAVIVYILSDTVMDKGDGSEPQPSHSHSFDAGAAWALLALQSTKLGYHAHGMTGVDFAAARAALGAPERFRIEAAVAIGRQGDKTVLPEALQAREVPSDRKPLAEIAFEGAFPA
jgi:nitroreductase